MVTISRTTQYASFRINHPRLAMPATTHLTKTDIAALIVASLIIGGNLYNQKTFDGTMYPTMINEIERAITTTNAFDPKNGNLDPKQIDALADILRSVSMLQTFGANLVYKSFVGDVYNAVRLSLIVAKAPLATLEALFEFEHAINTSKDPTLTEENIHYMVAIPRRRIYTYIYLPSENIIRIADDRTAASILAGLDSDQCYGGHLQIEYDRIIINDNAAGILRNASLVASVFQTQFSATPYHFTAGQISL